MLNFENFLYVLRKHDLPLADSIQVIEQYIDGLYLRIYKPASDIDEIFIVYHGGGVNSAAGYDVLAKQLVQYKKTCICLVDIREHGRSSKLWKVVGPKQIWQDVDTVVKYFKETSPQARIHLLGHSSGGGLLLNYFTRYSPITKVDSLILVAPEFGPFVRSHHLYKTSSMPFASVNKWVFVINALSLGLFFNNHIGVKLNFPKKVIDMRSDFIQKYSVKMANALTPRYPLKQLSRISLPVAIFIAENDEIFDAYPMLAFIKDCHNIHITSKIIKSTTHLDCIFNLSRDIKIFINR